MKVEQPELPGTVTEQDIIRRHFQKLGRKGAASTSPLLLEARRRNAARALAVRLERVKARREKNRE